MSKINIEIFIPELSANLKNEQHLTALNKLLSKADTTKSQLSANWMDNLCSLFNLSADNLPIAALTHLYDTNKFSDKFYLRADPVYLKTGIDRLYLVDAARALKITAAEASSLVEQLNQLFQQDGLEFSAPTPTRWYIALNHYPNLITHPLINVIGCDIHDYMPQGDSIWRLRLNEIQMLLHQSQVNIDREACGELAINSLWFWGLGKLPEVPSSNWTHVWSDDALAKGLAMFTKVKHYDVPTSITELLTSGNHLVTLFKPQIDSQTWLNQLEQLWFAPLLTALKQQQIENLVIYPDDTQKFVINSRYIRQWWRKLLPI
jgi:hypothetical protein